MTTQNSSSKTLVVIAILVLIAAGAYFVLNMPDQRTTGERVGDAVDTLGEQGPGEAVEELGDRTPGERLGDAVEDAGDEVEENTDR